MYSYIKGKITEKDLDRLTIECSGIGYEVFVSLNTLAKVSLGDEILLYTYFQVKQDGIALLGFDSREDKGMFLRLITVSGVGPKSALSILNEISPYDLACAIAKNDGIMLAKVKGIGKKTAARIVLELKEKIDLEQDIVVDSLSASTTRTSTSTYEGDAAVALQALGFSKAQAVKAITKAIEAGAQKTEDIIRQALKVVNL